MMNLLIHICCAPCATATVENWRAGGARAAGFFFNPNIHPFAEHERRREVLEGYAAGVGLELIGGPRYDVTRWLRRVTGKEQKPLRCRICIAERLGQTASTAAAGGFDAFTTSLLISPWQEHDIIMEEGEKASRESGVPFAYRDLRPLYRRSREMSGAAQLYRQRYCGCIYSEAEAALERAARKSERCSP